jgi:hypothetical protein
MRLMRANVLPDAGEFPVDLGECREIVGAPNGRELLLDQLQCRVAIAAIEVTRLA